MVQCSVNTLGQSCLVLLIPIAGYSFHSLLENHVSLRHADQNPSPGAKVKKVTTASKGDKTIDREDLTVKKGDSQMKDTSQAE